MSGCDDVFEQRPVCARCGSDDIAVDAVVRWDSEDGGWDISHVFEDSECASCGACGGDNESIKWISTTQEKTDAITN